MDKRTRAYKESQKQLDGVEPTSDIEPGVQTENSKSKLAVTRPWDNRGQNIGRQPWRMDMLMLKKKHQGFRCRFVDPKNVERREMRGYRIANVNDYGGVTDTKVIKDGTPLSTTLTRCGMILMEIPEEIIREQEQHQEARLKETMRDTKQRVKKEAVELGEDIGHSVSVFDEGKE